MFFDAHFHYAVMVQREICDFSAFCKDKDSCNWQGLSCAHSAKEWDIQSGAPDFVFKAFGIHPQLSGSINIDEYKDFLLELAENGKIKAIGEAGFDFFTEEFKSYKDIQENIWRFQLELAIKYQLPLVVHCRKANEKLFQYCSQLKKIPVVLFHSFMGSLVEANSLIKRNINCFFSFGKQIMNNNKKVIDCVKNLPLERLLFETDGPFQTLKGEYNTVPSDIIRIYKAGYKLRYTNSNCNLTDIQNKNKLMTFEEFCDRIYNNGKRLIN